MTTAPEGLSTELSSIDLVEGLVARKGWTHERANKDYVGVSLVGVMRTYDLMLSWHAGEDMLRLVCTFPFELLSEHQLPPLYDLLGRANDLVWSGSFSYKVAEKKMVWRYGVLLPGGRLVGDEQAEQMIMSAFNACERFYPAFALGTWSDTPPAEAIKIALAETYGRA